jgi:monofunctional biosynthetic peptidoglycan transglycosylase
VESTLVPVAELVLGKRRILELYLNVVGWGPGIYGAEAACRAYDGTTACKFLTRNCAKRFMLRQPLKEIDLSHRRAV